MRYIYYLVIFCLASVFLLSSCAKWVDKKASDPHLTNPYCNDPHAVNYNWGFPGTPNDSICFYPDDIFKGRYAYQDSVFLPDNTYLFSRTDTFSIFGIADTLIGIIGFCPNPYDTIRLSAGVNYQAIVDTVVGYGQLGCRQQDTLAGMLMKYNYNDTIMSINFTVTSDTGSTIHKGTAFKQY